MCDIVLPDAPRSRRRSREGVDKLEPLGVLWEGDEASEVERVKVAQLERGVARMTVCVVTFLPVMLSFAWWADQKLGFA